jgi:hypothetical protein
MQTYTHNELTQKYGETPVKDALRILEIPEQEKYDTGNPQVVKLLQQLSGHKNSGGKQSFADWSKNQQPIAQKPEPRRSEAEQPSPSSPQQIFSPDITAAIQELGGLESTIDPETLEELNKQGYARARSKAIALEVIEARWEKEARKDPAVLMVRQMLRGASYAPHEGMEETVIEMKAELEKHLPPSPGFLQNILPSRPSQPDGENGTGLKRLAGK